MKKNSKLKAVLHEEGVTLKALSKETGVPYMYLSLHMSGRANLSDFERNKVARFLRREEQSLFEES